MGTATELKSSASKRAKQPTRRASQRTKNVPGLDDWDGWCRHLQNRKKPGSLAKLIPGLNRPILSWPLQDAWHGSESEKFVKLLERYSRGERASHSGIPDRLESWLDGVPARPADPGLAIECIAWCHSMPRLAQCLPAAPWCQLLESLQGIAEQSAGLDQLEDPLTQQMLAGELPLTIATVFPELEGCRSLARSACQALSHGIVELTDGEGLLGAQFLAVARPLLACWTRCGFIGRRTGEVVFDQEGQTQLDWLVLQTLRLARTDGSQVLTTGLSGAYCGPLIDAALMLTDDPIDRVVASRVLAKSPGKVPRPTRKDLPAPSVASEWAEVAILRRTWERQSHQLAVTYHAQQIESELNSGSTTVWSGPANPEFQINGQPLKLSGEWEEVCSVTDDEAEYVELEMSLPTGRSVQRQMLLARNDRFLLVSDVLLGAEEAEIDYCHRIPLADGIEFVPEEETREGRLMGKRRLGAVLPLALPEWRCERVAGELVQEDRSLLYRLKVKGRRLYAPLLFDLDPARSQKKLTWRRLTVAEHLELQPNDVAAGFRAQIGLFQWLIYRSLTGQANRSLLGQNVSCEFLAGRFNRNGEVTKFVEIE